MAAQSRSHTANKLPLLPPRQSLGTLLSYFQHAACAGTFGCGTKLYNIMEKLNPKIKCLHKVLEKNYPSSTSLPFFQQIYSFFKHVRSGRLTRTRRCHCGIVSTTLTLKLYDNEAGRCKNTRDKRERWDAVKAGILVNHNQSMSVYFLFSRAQRYRKAGKTNQTSSLVQVLFL